MSLKDANSENLQLRLVLLLGAFYAYIGPPALAVYGIAIIKGRNLFCNHLVATNFSFIVVWFVRYGIWEALVVFRFHFGFFVFFLFFKRFSAVSLKACFFTLLSLLVEGLLVNSVIDAKSLPNYPDEAARKHFHDGWQRSYSFGAIPSVSVLFVAIARTIALTRRRMSL